MNDDPNADLIHSIIQIDGVEYRVLHSVTWSQQYVQLGRYNSRPGEPDDLIVRRAGDVRRSLQLNGDAIEACRCVYPDKCFCGQLQA